MKWLTSWLNNNVLYLEEYSTAKKIIDEFAKTEIPRGHRFGDQDKIIVALAEVLKKYIGSMYGYYQEATPEQKAHLRQLIVQHLVTSIKRDRLRIFINFHSAATAFESGAGALNSPFIETTSTSYTAYLPLNYNNAEKLAIILERSMTQMAKELKVIMIASPSYVNSSSGIKSMR
jgi:hypothetical protein